MPTFYRIFGCKINLYFYDHSPPHSHAYYAEYEVVIDLESLGVIDGDMPGKKLKKIIKWAKKNKVELQDIWNKLSEDEKSE